MFEHMNLEQLATVHGGAEGAGPNQWNEDVSLPVPGTPPIIHNEQSRSDYGQCIDKVTAGGGTYKDFAAACGLPPAAGS